MSNIDALKRELERKEGRKTKAYKDTEGHWTIAIGHLLNPQTDAELAILGLDDDLDDWEGFEISEEQIEQLLDHDVDETLRSLRNAFDDELLENLDPKRFMAAFQMCYQIGSVTGFPAFCEAVRKEDWERAAKEMLYRDGLKCEIPSRWHRQTPGRCEYAAELMRIGSVEIVDTEPDRILAVEEGLCSYSTIELLQELIQRENPNKDENGTHS